MKHTHNSSYVNALSTGITGEAHTVIIVRTHVIWA